MRNSSAIDPVRDLHRTRCYGNAAREDLDTQAPARELGFRVVKPQRFLEMLEEEP